MKKKKIIIVILIGIIVSGIALLYSSYALFSANQISKSAITIKAGTMNGTIKVDGTTTNKLTLAKGAKQTFVVTLENLNAIDGKFIPYYSGTIPAGVTFGYLESTGIDVPVEATLAKNGKKTYSIYLENNSTSSVTINLGVQGGLSNQPLSLPANSYLIPQAVKKNTNISNIWKYDQTTGSSTFCVTGEESTCLPINPETFETGTIIKYKVNDTTEKYFHVMFDEGDTLTLQQRENTVNATNWYTSRDNTKGPVTALTSLETATSGWSNVLNQTYTLGSTIFKDNAYTGCTDTSCTRNTYTLPSRTAKARLISVQEILKLKTSSKAPVWMHNYLNSSISSGGTVNGSDYGYWTSSANSSLADRAWSFITTGGLFYMIETNSGASTPNSVGVRAVIKIEKSKVITPSNFNITHVYRYDQTNASTKCITGEESTCVELSERPETYTMGTIVKYKVNDATEKYFHVVSDNGDTLTLQQRENTVNNVAWYTTQDSTKGPLTILPALESATSSWSNVLDQTYALGTTVFKDNKYTGCPSYNSCTTNQYTLATRTAKARLMTTLEAATTGCSNMDNNCPIWMINYLSASIKYGGTVNGTDFGYWTSSSYSSTSTGAWYVNTLSRMNAGMVTLTNVGARAVVIINK